MLIIFNGTTLDLVKRLQRFSGSTEKVTLDFILENFKMMQHQNREIVHAIYNDEKTKEEIDTAAVQL